MLGELTNLRAIERSDIPCVHAWMNDATVMRGWGWSAPCRSLHDVATQVEGWLAQEVTLGRPAALIGETLAGEPIGLIVLMLERAEAHAAELSLLIGDPTRWGSGLGSDLLETVLDAAFGGWGLHRIGIRVEASNSRALALYQGRGFQVEGRLREAAFLDGRRQDVVLLGLLAPEWLAPSAASPAD